MLDYSEFIESKVVRVGFSGFEVDRNAINKSLFEWQKDVVSWTLKKGRAAIFAACGLGKTPMQLEWSDKVVDHTGAPVLIVAPLAVSMQTKREGEKFGYAVNPCRSQDDVVLGINITNYEMLDKFDADTFGGVVIDESSILKNMMGKTRTAIINQFEQTPYKLACTATPAPNDHTELTNHAEFLNVMRGQEMLANWFVNDGFDVGTWRLKKHAVNDFWRFVSTWAVSVSKPSDIGYSNEGYDLPSLNTHVHVVESEKTVDGMLVDIRSLSATEINRDKKKTIAERARFAADVVNSNDEMWIVWVNQNEEADAIKHLIPDALEVRGSMKLEEKESVLEKFSRSEFRVLIAKPSMCGFGLNWQHVHNMVFVGLSYSFEQRYQAVRRCWRFGQEREVNDHVVLSRSEESVFRRVLEKERKHVKMEKSMQTDLNRVQDLSVNGDDVLKEYVRNEASGDGWTIVNGDSCQEIKRIQSDSMGFSIFSPPFSSLFVYSKSYLDMGNCANDSEFFKHFDHLIPELFRITKPGRLCAVHCSQLPLHKYKDGSAGLKDFRGDIIRAFQAHGWTYHSEVCIWKNPVVEMQRTKSNGLLHKQLCKDSSAVRVGMPDYLVVFRKNTDEGSVDPVTRPNGLRKEMYAGTDDIPTVRDDGSKTNESIEIWQRYASPVWFDIDQTKVLNVRVARADEDERHLCPLQLDVIERAIHLWTKPGDTVFTPFCGIGSEVYSAVKLGRNGYGIELKPEYFVQAVKNMGSLQESKRQLSLLELM